MGIDITTDDTFFYVDFGVLADAAKMLKAKYRRDALIGVTLVTLDGGNVKYVEVSIQQERKKWQVSCDGTAYTLPVATIDEVAPTDIDDLYDKVCAIKQ